VIGHILANENGFSGKGAFRIKGSESVDNHLKKSEIPEIAVYIKSFYFFHSFELAQLNA